jgi:chromosome segregation ATPase
VGCAGSVHGPASACCRQEALKYSPLPETAAVEIGDAIEQGAGGGEIPPELQQAIEAGKEQISKLTEENQQLRQDQENKVAKLSIDKQDADTRRIKAEGDLSLETMQQRIDALHATVDRLLAAHQATKQDEGSADGY